MRATPRRDGSVRVTVQAHITSHLTFNDVVSLLGYHAAVFGVDRLPKSRSAALRVVRETLESEGVSAFTRAGDEVSNEAFMEALPSVERLVSELFPDLKGQSRGPKTE